MPAGQDALYVHGPFFVLIIVSREGANSVRVCVLQTGFSV